MGNGAGIQPTSEQMIHDHRRWLDGDMGEPGLRKRTRALEEWQSLINDERRTIKALLVGISIGMGLNGLGILAILSQLTGG